MRDFFFVWLKESTFHAQMVWMHLAELLSRDQCGTYFRLFGIVQRNMLHVRSDVYMAVID